MKRTLHLVGAAILLFAAGAYALWRGASDVAYKKTLETLKEARASFSYITDSAAEGILWFGSSLMFDDIASALPSPSVSFMQDLAARYHMDEINIISTNGIIVASNFKELVGFDMKPHETVWPILNLLDDDSPYGSYSQPFRVSLGNDKKTLYKYFAKRFPDGSGILEIGITMEHYTKAVANGGPEDYYKWRIGQYGYFGSADRNHNGRIDRAKNWGDGLPPEGILCEEMLPEGEWAYVLYFPHAGLVYRAVEPKREFYDQRNRIVLLFYSISGTLFLVFVFFIVKILRTSDKLNEMHCRMEERAGHELALARNIQLSSLQRAETFRLGEFDSSFSAVTYPAREVGGDLYGMFALSDGKVAFAVGDVSGKGVPAAMFMHVAKNSFEQNMRTHGVLTEAVTQANAYLCERNQTEMFVTSWFGVLDPKTGIVEYVNAGHNRPFILRANGSVERIDGKGGRFLGVFPKATYRAHRLLLKAGDRIFAYTDGVTEAMDAERHLYGEGRLVTLLRRHPSDVCTAVKQDVDAFVKGVEQSDDLTMLAMTYHGKPERIEQEFVADPEMLGEMLEFVRGVVRFQYAKQETRLLNAVDEVLSNIVNYSGSPKIVIQVKNAPGKSCVVISDEGAAYDPLTHQDPDVHASLRERPIGGLGILMVKKLVGSITYRRQDGKNVLTLVQLDFTGKYRQDI